MTAYYKTANPYQQEVVDRLNDFVNSIEREIYCSRKHHERRGRIPILYIDNELYMAISQSSMPGAASPIHIDNTPKGNRAYAFGVPCEIVRVIGAEYAKLHWS